MLQFMSYLLTYFCMLFTESENSFTIGNRILILSVHRGMI